MTETTSLIDWIITGGIILAKILIIVVPLMLCVAYLTYAERKVIGYMQLRIGPNRVGPRGWLQPIADAVKLMFKEVIIPAKSNYYLFVIAPTLAIGPALAAWAVIPFDDGLVLADVDASLLYILALTSVGVYGVIIAGWASNSKYAFISTMRSAAQIVSYEIAMGFALVGVLMAAGSINLGDIVMAQQGSLLHWYWLPLLPLFLIWVNISWWLFLFGARVIVDAYRRIDPIAHLAIDLDHQRYGFGGRLSQIGIVGGPWLLMHSLARSKAMARKETKVVTSQCHQCREL